jgi:phage gp46-like protein
VNDLYLDIAPATGECDFVYDEDLADYKRTDTVRNNLILSIENAKASWYAAQNIGSDHHKIDRLTASAPDRVKVCLASATQWTIDAGRCSKIEVDAVADEANKRIVVTVKATQINGVVIPYTTYFRVV